MLNNLLTATEKTRNASLPEAALYALLGFAIVFLGIAFLILIVWLVGKGMGKASAVAVKPQEKVNEEKAESSKAKGEEITEETIAVITAALMAYYEQTGAKCEFTVKRIKRI